MLIHSTKEVTKQGVEKIKRLLANLTYIEMSVVKATSAVDGPPKRQGW